jgi:hypothetical protein
LSRTYSAEDLAKGMIKTIDALMTMTPTTSHIKTTSNDKVTEILGKVRQDLSQLYLDEKVRKMAEIIIEKPSMQKVIYELEKPSEELAFGYYILFICSHAYSMRQRKVLNEDEWTGWLQWMRNCFKHGTIGEQWKQIQSERWFNPAFEEFINREIIPTVKENK